MHPPPVCPRRTYFCYQVVIALKREEKNATTNDQPRSANVKPAENEHGKKDSGPKSKQQPDTAAQLDATLPPSKKFHYFA